MGESREVRFTVDPEYDGLRADLFLALIRDDMSRSRLSRLIESGAVSVNGKTVVKSSFRVSEDDSVTLLIPEAEVPEVLPEDIPLDILYEDNDVIVVNKPKGMVVHPSAGHMDGTLVNALLYHCTDLSGINGVLRPGIVHRIDKDTSGSVIACKNDFAHNKIAAALKDHSLKRLYRAIVKGGIREDGTVDKPVGRDKNDRKKMGISPDGKRAVTHYKVLETFKDYTYIECSLETGRTHQIRVHMASIGHPVLGDQVYGGGKSPYKTEGQTLHAMVLGFIQPVTGEYIETTAPLPDYFMKILTDLRRRN